jgi:hypothetical protein
MTPRRGMDPALIFMFLQRCEQNHLAKTYGALFGGAMLSLIGPLVITFSSLILSMGLIIDYGFWVAYLIIAAVTLPILFLIAYKVQGSILENTVADGAPFGAGFLVRILVVAEIANIGPRLVLWGIAQLRGRQPMGKADFDRLTEAVGVLSASDGGIGPVNLLKPGESADDLAPLLAILFYYDIADMSKAGDRIWLSSHAKEQILAQAKRGIRPR